jgi:hypothetical protein
MALIMCPECGNEVSDKAPTCPKCGVPISSESTSIIASPSSDESVATKVTDTWGFRLAVLLGAAAVIVGVWALVTTLRPSSQDLATPAATDAQQQPAEAEPHAAAPSETVDPPVGPQRTCLDGLQVARGEQCDLLSNDAVFAAAVVTPDQCTQEADAPWNAPGQRFTCTIDTGEMQIGRFRNASAKAERVAKYRAYHYCAPYDGTWQVCGGSGAGQGWLRTYLADDLLMYMSSQDKGVLLALGGVSEDVLRYGSD